MNHCDKEHLLDETALSHNSHEQLIDEALHRFDNIHTLQRETITTTARRVDFLHRVMFIGFGLVVVAIFFMLLVISMHMYSMTEVITKMNSNFTQMNQDMDAMLKSMARMDSHVDSMSMIVWRMDTMNNSVDSMTTDMHEIYQRMALMEGDMEQLSRNVSDMRESFRLMDANMGLMTFDVQHMSQPMRLFNQFNPFR